MKILSHKNINLHSASTPGGLLSIQAKRNLIVPDDVADHPAFQWLQDDGTIVVFPDDIQEQREAELARMLAAHPGFEATLNDARISGSPLQLVEAEIVKAETEKTEDETESESDEDGSEEESEDSEDETEEEIEE